MSKKTLVIKNNIRCDQKLTVNRDLTVNKNLIVEHNSVVKRQTTIHQLYGGESIKHGWRDIIVNGGHIRFCVRDSNTNPIKGNCYGFHNNEHGLYCYDKSGVARSSMM